jgi:hypothetical protein
MNKKLMLSLLFALPLISCSIFGGDNYSFLRASVKFPYRSFNIKVIPDNTNFILVKVAGEGLTEPILFELNRENTSKLLKNIPQGYKQVNASAIDEDGNIIAKGQNSVNVILHKLNTVEVELKLNDNLKPFPSIEPINCQIELYEKDLPLPENLAKAIQNAGCKITTLPTPTPIPTSNITSSPSIPSSEFPNSSSSGTSNNNVNTNVSVIDGQQKDTPDIIVSPRL